MQANTSKSNVLFSNSAQFTRGVLSLHPLLPGRCLTPRARLLRLGEPLTVQSIASYALSNYAIVDPARCPGCITINGTTFLPAYFDLPSFTFP